MGQGDALREWDSTRRSDDVAIVLNTGAGKTLVGLLIAQSLVNETRRNVIYACSSIQLIDQTATKAQGYGLPVTTYYDRTFSGDGLYLRAEAPCVTTYQALFNGKTRFSRDDVAAVVFDDAHAAEHILRDQFSLVIARGELPETYERILALFEPFHNSVGLSSSYAEVYAGRSSRQFFVPPFEVRRNLAELRRLLLDAGPDQSTNTMFAWEHIRDHEDLCCLLISNGDVTLTPPVLPVSVLPYFRKSVRRVYLSATLKAPDSFVRAFGRQPDKIVAPSTPAGECERLILIPSVVDGIDDDTEPAKEVLGSRKALILVPNTFERSKWNDISQSSDRQNVPEAVEAFREADPPAKLTLAARYDGIDLPGETCRMMVLDGLPKGAGPLEKYQWERLNMQNTLHSTLSSRIVQSFGRISRGMSDHGVVVITGKSLVEWLLLPRNRSILPGFLQKQIAVGEAVSKRAQNTADLVAAAHGCLNRDPNWIRAYAEHMQGLFESEPAIDLDMALNVAVAEAEFGRTFWNRDYEGAVKVLEKVLNESFEFSQFSGAWNSLWLGYAYELTGDNDSANHLYRRARGAQQNIPLSVETPPSVATTAPGQVRNIAAKMRIGGSGSASVRLPKTITRDLDPLKENASHGRVEEALRSLGEYLGLDSTRPDKEFGTGPDVLWIDEDRRSICMEAKTNKEPDSEYYKHDVAQLHDHIQWTHDNHQVSVVIPVFVGPRLPVSKLANPTEDMRIVELHEFNELAEALVSALRDVADSAMPLSLEQRMFEVMKNRCRLSPEVFRTLNANRLSDGSHTRLL